MRTATKRTRETKPKTKTFTGCWTCRARKVKCDATRPTCNRCIKACVHCEGYDLKLYWITDEDTVAPSAIKRQARSLEHCPRWSYQLDEVDKQLSDLDTYDSWAIAGGGPVSTGPFAIFSISNKHVRPSNGPAGSQHMVDSGMGSSPSLATSSDEDEYSHISDFDILVGPVTQSSVPEFRGGAFPASLSTQLRSPSITTFAPSMFQDPLLERLMANYLSNVANVLPPIPHPENPYSSIYYPQAMIGAANLLSGMSESSSDIASGHVAIFYALLATSAFHLRGSEDGRHGGDFDVIARKFRAKAFEELQKALQEPGLSINVDENGTPGVSASLINSNTSERARSSSEAVISAMLSLSSMDVMEGSMSEYWIHLSGIDRLGRQIRRGSTESPTIDRLITNSSFLSTIASTTSLDLPLLLWTGDHGVEDDQFATTGIGYGLEFTYGITATLANLMHRIVVLSQNISYYVSNALSIPPSLMSSCTMLSETLSSWSMDDEPMICFPNKDSSFLLAKTHILAFAAALRVYYHTRILPCSSTEMSVYVGRVANLLTDIETTKAQCGYDTDTMATITWPGFIASCEAKPEEREVWYRLWKKMVSYRIGNIAQLWVVVQDAWKIRDEGCSEVPAWMPVLRRGGSRIFAI